MRFFAKLRDILIKILTKIKCKSSCFNTIDSHDITIIDSEKLQNELKDIRHDIKNTLHGMNYLVEHINSDEEKSVHREQIFKTVDLINNKINIEFLRSLERQEDMDRIDH